MSPRRALTLLSAALLTTLNLTAAKLVELPTVRRISPAFEENKGQTRTDILYLTHSATSSLGITRQAIVYWPAFDELRFAGGNPAPLVRPFDQLPGVANYYSGATPPKAVTGIRRYDRIDLQDVYRAVDFSFTFKPAAISLRIVCRPGCDPHTVVFETSKGFFQYLTSGAVVLRYSNSPYDLSSHTLNPSASQDLASGPRQIRVTGQILSDTRLGFDVQPYDSAFPLNIDLDLAEDAHLEVSQSTVDSSRNTYSTASVADTVAAAEPPFPSLRWQGCGDRFRPVSCLDVAVHKFSPQSELQWVTYLAGRTTEAPGVILASQNQVVIAGTTDSIDFPVSASAFQLSYAGPAATPRNTPNLLWGGDAFAAKLDPLSGRLTSSTYAGGPDQDNLWKAYLAADGSIFLLSSSTNYAPNPSSRLPVTPGALLPACPGSARPDCASPHILRLDPALSHAIYGTFLPQQVTAGDTIVAPGADGSLYFAGSSGSGFPVTATAFQKTPAGPNDVVLGRLSPTGSALTFATYSGTPAAYRAAAIAPAPDGSLWAAIASLTAHSTLIHLDATGSKVLSSVPLAASALTIDPAGNLYALASKPGLRTAGALLDHSCGSLGLFLGKFDSAATLQFGTYLPPGWYDFVTFSDTGNPILSIPGTFLELRLLSDPLEPYAGCVVSAASLDDPPEVAAGQIITIFGSAIGPRTPAVASPTQGQLPTTLGGTQILLNGEPIPLLFASYSQVNAILPYTLKTAPQLQVRLGLQTSPPVLLQYDGSSRISLFAADGSGSGQAAALNQDYSVNSPQNPAPLGSTIMLFGTGGGQTDPPSTAGEITPLTIRRLTTPVFATLATIPLTVEFAGAAPGLPAGLNQFNIRLPASLPAAFPYPSTAVPIVLNTLSNPNFTRRVTIAVR